MTHIPDKALEVIAGRKQVSTVYAKVDMILGDMILGDVFVTDADLALELIEAREERDAANSECKDWYNAAILARVTDDERFRFVYALHRKRLGL